MTVELSGGCIRFYAEGPVWHIDDGHKTIGLFDIRQAPTIDAQGFLVVGLVDENYQVNHKPVVTLIPSVDETLTARGISAGCSNGGPYIRIRFYMDGVGALDLNLPEHYIYLRGKYNNLWLGAMHLDTTGVV